MLKLWANIPERLVDGITPIKVFFMSVLSLTMIASIVLGYRYDRTYLTIGIFIELVFFWYGLEIGKRVRSGKRQLDLKGDITKTKEGKIYTASYRVSLYTGGVVASLALTLIAGILLIYFPDPQHLDNLPKRSLTRELLLCILAGAEEVWRLCMIIVIMYFLKKGIKKKWVQSNVKWGIFVVSIVISSFVFGWLHTFAYATNTFFSVPITLVLGAAGMTYAILIFLTRRFWLAIVMHILFDMTNTLLRVNETFWTPWVNGLMMAILLIALISLPIYLFMHKKFEKELNEEEAF